MAVLTDAKPKATVFYSWQSDLPNSTNRGLILDALERAARKIRMDDSVAVDPVPDRDTQNVSGSPDIARTIFEKIEKATAFVADVSIINPGLGRPTPNPNVLIELGYALKKLGSVGIILVANTATGPIESLPFDLRTKRILTYHLPPGAHDKPEQRSRLQEGLELALRAILVDVAAAQRSKEPSSADKAVEGIEKRAPNQGRLCNQLMSEIAQQVRELTPNLGSQKPDEWDELLMEAIARSLPLVTDFTRAAEAAAIYDSKDAALELFRGFAALFIQYNLPPGTGSTFYEVQFDLPKFIGHELMVTLLAPLIKERRWTIVSAVCRERIVVPNTTDGRTLPVNFLYASAPIRLLEHRCKRLKLNLNPLLLHGVILKERHENGQLGELLPWQRFQAADIFLYLRSVLEPAEISRYDFWTPWSALIRSRCPDFLHEAIQLEKAEALVEPLGIASLDELRKRLKLRAHTLDKEIGPWIPFFNLFEGLQPDLIGTK